MRRTGLLTAAAIGIGLGIVGWYQASDRATPARQSGPAALSVAGAILVLAAAGMWLGGYRRLVRGRTRQLLGEVAPATVRHLPMATDARLVGGAGLRFYHRADCILAPSTSRRPRRGQEPCGVCRPEQIA